MIIHNLTKENFLQYHEEGVYYQVLNAHHYSSMAFEVGGRDMSAQELWETYLSRSECNDFLVIGPHCIFSDCNETEIMT